MAQPHDNWGSLYDYVYEKTFGHLYHDFTRITLETIHELLDKGSILDFGAGTGRLSIPLAKQGYRMIAVERSSGMVDTLRNKMVENHIDVDIHHCSISDYENGKADLALALFTVLSYSTTELELADNIAAMCKHVNPGGHLFFDLPTRVFFQMDRLHNINRPDFKRVVTLVATNDSDIYSYREKCHGICDGQEFRYEDEFKIRYWDLDTLDKLLIENGFEDTGRLYVQFAVTGSTYKLYKRKS